MPLFRFSGDDVQGSKGPLALDSPVRSCHGSVLVSSGHVYPADAQGSFLCHDSIRFYL